MYKLVIIDDEYWAIEGMREIIDWEKYNIKIVGEAFDGEEGLEIIKEINPDIVIVDICMGKMDGLEMIENLRELNYKGKIIITSGYQFFEYAKRSIDLKVEKYLTKPINVVELENTIAQITNWKEKASEDDSKADDELNNESNNEANNESNTKSKDNIDAMIKEIDTNYMNDIKLSAFAQKFYCTPAYISKMFKKHTGTNFIDYITRKRIDKAKELLRNSDAKIDDIAWNVGYEDVKHFRENFKKLEGISPKEYRNKCKFNM